MGKKTLLTLLSVLCAWSVTATACGNSNDETTKDSSDTTAPTGKKIRLWLNGPDTPDALVQEATAQFNEIHPDVEVTFERQQWSGLIDRLTTTLSSNDSPDVIELGNTMAQTFAAAGALENLTGEYDRLGGGDLLQSLEEAGTYNDQFYAVPYYAGARIILYRTDLFAEAGIEIPATIEEMIEDAETLSQDTDQNFSGFYLPGRNWLAALSFIWDSGGDIATLDGDTWTGTLSSSESVEGLATFARIFNDVNAAPADRDASQDYIAFCNGDVAMMPAPGWKPGEITNETDGCPEMEPNIGAFAMPSATPGETAPVFLGGSVLAIPTQSANKKLATDLLQVMVGLSYQAELSATGVIPARESLLDKVDGSEAAIAQAKAARNSRFVPTSDKWAAVEAEFILQDMLTSIARGDDISDAAAKADASIEAILNG